MVHQDTDFHGVFIAHLINKEVTMRYFDPTTMTEVLPVIHNTAGTIELPDDNWFFTLSYMPQGKRLAANENGEPILVDITDSEQ